MREAQEVLRAEHPLKLAGEKSRVLRPDAERYERAHVPEDRLADVIRHWSSLV